MANLTTIPNICRTTNGLPAVKWCIDTLKWAGWQYEGISPFYDSDTGLTHRLYFHIDPNGRQYGLNASGLRQEAETLWMQAQVCAEIGRAHV